MGLNLLRSTQLGHVIVNSAASGALAITAASAGTFARIYRVILVTGGATTITFQDTGPNAISAPFAFSGAGSLVLDEQISGDPWFQATTAGLGLQLNNSAAVQVSADIWYLQGP